MQLKNAKDILLKYREGTCTKEEKAFIDNWILYGDVKSLDLTEEDLTEDLSEIRQRLLLDLAKVKIIHWWPRVAAAAIIFMTCSIGLYFYLNQTPDRQLTVKSKPSKTDIGPGGDKAILTLANGSKIVLNNAADGEIAKQAGVIITKTTDGQLVYNVSSSSSMPNTQPVYNTIETPKGGQYQIKLPDGTKVWLNAASSLRFPAAFSGKERNVELTGEGYFEVAKNKKMPFHVVSNNQVVEVLGTHFNINSYGDETSVKTTLLEGSVLIISSVENLLLKPGQQSILQKNNIIRVQSIDVNEVVAWKDGLFQFNNTDLRAVMRQLSRWYDVTVRYEGEIPKQEFGGAIERNLRLSEVFEILEKSKVHFRVEGREVIVMP